MNVQMKRTVTAVLLGVSMLVARVPDASAQDRLPPIPAEKLTEEIGRAHV